MNATVDRLLDAAESAMRLKGYHAVSFRDLAADLGIKSASVHYYYRQKEELGLALVERYSERFFQDLDARAAKAQTPAERMAAFCRTYEVALKTSDKVCLCGMLGAEICGLPERLANAVAAFFNGNIDWVAAALAPGRQKEASRARAVQIVSTLQGAMMLATSLKDRKIFDAAAAAVLRDVGRRPSAIADD